MCSRWRSMSGNQTYQGALAQPGEATDQMATASPHVPQKSTAAVGQPEVIEDTEPAQRTRASGF